MADADDVRSRLQELIQRAEGDEGFAKSLRESPDRLASESGLDREFLDVASGRVAADEVTLRRYGCNDFTCFSSACPGTCYVTICHTTFWLAQESKS